MKNVCSLKKNEKEEKTREKKISSPSLPTPKPVQPEFRLSQLRACSLDSRA